MRRRASTFVLLCGVALCVAGCRKKPDCFECGLTDEWARAEEAERERQRIREQSQPRHPDGPEGEPADTPAPPDDTHDADPSIEQRRGDEFPPIPPPRDQNCAEHTEAIAACRERGPNYVYNLWVEPWGKGTRPPDDYYERARERARCRCYDEDREAEKSRIPLRRSPDRDERSDPDSNTPVPPE